MLTTDELVSVRGCLEMIHDEAMDLPQVGGGEATIIEQALAAMEIVNRELSDEAADRAEIDPPADLPHYRAIDGGSFGWSVEFYEPRGAHTVVGGKPFDEALRLAEQLNAHLAIVIRESAAEHVRAIKREFTPPGKARRQTIELEKRLAEKEGRRYFEVTDGPAGDRPLMQGPDGDPDLME